jgi:hypothetical protein
MKNRFDEISFLLMTQLKIETWAPGCKRRVIVWDMERCEKKNLVKNILAINLEV